ncbi:unnamed protein product [Closterium sp. Naga37s-1]|nr:unnamed protein product [Closterium sp. Naga37s-1]
MSQIPVAILGDISRDTMVRVDWVIQRGAAAVVRLDGGAAAVRAAAQRSRVYRHASLPLSAPSHTSCSPLNTARTPHHQVCDSMAVQQQCGHILDDLVRPHLLFSHHLQPYHTALSPLHQVCDSMAVQQQCGQILDDLMCATPKSPVPLPTLLPALPLLLNQVCDSMAVQQQCGQILDDLVCAATCDPYAGSYVTVNEFVGSTEVAVCLREAEAVFEACKDILFISTSKGATLDLTPYFPDSRTFMTQIVGGILRVVMGNDKVQVVLTSTNCIAGNTNVYPPATSCCDTFSSVPDTCTVTNEFSSLLNRPTPPACLAATTTLPVNTPIPAPTPAVSPVPSTSPVPVVPALPSTAAPRASPRISPIPSVPKAPSLPSSPSPPASSTPSPSLDSLPPPSPSPPPPPSPPKAASPPAAAAFVSIISCLVCGVMALLAPGLLI